MNEQSADVTVPVAHADDAEELFEHAPCGYVTMELDGTIVRVNATLLAWTGFARGELVGRRRFAELLTRGGQLYYETHYAPLLSMQGSVTEIAFEIERPDGSRLPVLVNATLELDAAGLPRSIRAAVFDARQRRSYERELVRMRDVEREARTRTERLQRVSRALAVTLEPSAIGEAVLAALSPADSGQSALLVIGADGRSLELVAWRGERPPVTRSRLVDGQLPAGPAAPLGMPTEAWGARVTILHCAVDGRSVGILCVGRAAAAPDEADDAFLVSISEQCALALERTRLYAQTVADARRSRLLARVASGLSEVNDVAGRTLRLQELLVPEVADEVTLRASDDLPIDPQGPAAAQIRLAQRAISSHSLQRGTDAGSTLVALPLVAGGAPLAVLMLVRGPDRPDFGDSELALVRDIGASATTALAGARLFERERDVANTLQEALLASPSPDDPRIELSTYYGPAVQGLNVGGDWYDAFTAAPGRLSLVVGDIVGQGLPAASAMGRLRSAVRAFAVAGSRPGALLQQLDAFVALDAPARMATLVYAEIDLEAGTVSMASAGHPPAVVLEPGGAPRLIWDGRSPPLGVYPVSTLRPDTTFPIATGARLILYTDGLVERREHALDVGFARLVEAATTSRHATVATMVDDIVHTLLLDHPTHDDVCILGVQVSPGASAL